ncbi:PepSY domain-containing protein [Alteromonas pelagimontana]|uniref:PepSY domain-containing protein n=1 Tax=Alteromonas pelagimontana TaxID=1858656 RepID=A0A6M4MC57_9ALTE|nr:PepSY-associated TM helix domain-containing protein [Alteromonas pelagimontana]QJR80784.1 PepSY domain-containing protein [Alteromonas pelagimontana]
MKGTLRQTMTWLHTWSSITAGWILFAIFLTGTLAFFRIEINHWMQPEKHVSVPGERVATAMVGYQYLQTHAPQASQWQISLPDERERTLGVSWQTPGEPQQRRRGPRAELDASTGEIIAPRETAGGNFLYRFHFELYGMPRDVARLLVSIVSMMMLVGLISGVIMHRKIFSDFFMFRPKKKLLSWIDGHVISAVLALPFHIMITFSGLILLANAFLPWHADENRRQQNRGERPAQEHVAPVQKDFSIAAPLEEMMLSASSQWGVPVTSISVVSPGTQKAVYTLSGANRTELSAGRGGNTSIEFDYAGNQVRQKPAAKAQSTPQAIYNFLDMLHQARFADVITRWLLFIAGVLGTLMVATGSVLWAVKRAKQQLGQAGFEFVRGLNVASIAGVTCATGVYFWANRLIPSTLAERSDWEINSFFISWAVCIVAGFIKRDRLGWIIQLSAAAVLFTLLPFLDTVTSPVSVLQALIDGDWLRIGVDGMSLIVAASLWMAVFYLQKQKRSPARTVSCPTVQAPSAAREQRV